MGSLVDAIGPPGERTIAERLGTIERVLFAVARAQGIDPQTQAEPAPHADFLNDPVGST